MLQDTSPTAFYHPVKNSGNSKGTARAINTAKRQAIVDAGPPLPAKRRRWFSHAEEAALVVVARAAAKNGGTSSMAYDDIAELSFNTLTTVASALKRAARFGMIERTQRHLLTSLTTIVDDEWRKILNLPPLGPVSQPVETDHQPVVKASASPEKAVEVTLTLSPSVLEKFATADLMAELSSRLAK